MYIGKQNKGRQIKAGLIVTARECRIEQKVKDNKWALKEKD
jgi:hypothetical protein